MKRNIKGEPNSKQREWWDATRDKRKEWVGKQIKKDQLINNPS